MLAETRCGLLALLPSPPDYEGSATYSLKEKGLAFIFTMVVC